MLSAFPCWYDNAIVWENHEYKYDNRCTRLHCAPDGPTRQISSPRFWWLNFQMDRSRRLLGVSCSYSNTRHVECLLSDPLGGFRCMRKMNHTASLKKCKGNFWQSRYQVATMEQYDLLNVDLIVTLARLMIPWLASHQVVDDTGICTFGHNSWNNFEGSPPSA